MDPTQISLNFTKPNWQGESADAFRASEALRHRQTLILISWVAGSSYTNSSGFFGGTTHPGVRDARAALTLKGILTAGKESKLICSS